MKSKEKKRYNCVCFAIDCLFTFLSLQEYLLKIPDLKILRIYGNLREQEEFPVPNLLKPGRRTRSKAELKVPESLKKVAMHYVIRQDKSPYASQLKEYENHFADMKEKKERVSQTDIKMYLQVGRLLLVLAKPFWGVMVTWTGGIPYALYLKVFCS